MEIIGQKIKARTTGLVGTIEGIDKKGLIVNMGIGTPISMAPEKIIDAFVIDDELKQEIENLKSIAKTTNKSQSTKQKSAKVEGTENIAFKITYCDGGESESNYGFRGICTDKCRKINQKLNRAWCTEDRCSCAKFTNGIISFEEFQRQTKEFCCYESRLLIDWKAYAGMDNTKNPPRPRKFNQLNPNGFAVLTTENHDEKERYIFGIFKIANYFEGNETEEGYVEADDKLRIEFTKEESKKLRFWDFYSNKTTEREVWGAGLFRYMSDEQVLMLLKEAYSIKEDELSSATISEMIEILSNNK